MEHLSKAEDFNNLILISKKIDLLLSSNQYRGIPNATLKKMAIKQCEIEEQIRKEINNI